MTRFTRRMTIVSKPTCFRMLVAVMLLVTVCGCRTPAPLPAVDTTQPGWRVRNGQAIWQLKKDSPELAGELQVATHTSGESLVQFTKTPLPFVVARAGENHWQAEFPPQNRRFGGAGKPPVRFGWLHLAACLRGEAPPPGWSFQQRPDNTWRLENSRTGERMEGWLGP